MAANIESEDGDLGFQIAPMVDVVFVLMLFFMASAGMQEIEKGLSTGLPSHPQPGMIVHPTVYVDIASDGQISVNGQFFDSPSDRRLPELRAWLKQAVVDFDNQDPVVLRPSPETMHERITDVLSAAAAVGVQKLSFN